MSIIIHSSFTLLIPTTQVAWTYFPPSSTISNARNHVKIQLSAMAPGGKPRAAKGCKQFWANSQNFQQLQEPSLIL